MRKIVFATNNNHKLAEVREILKGHIEIVSLKEIGFEGDIEETEETLEGNALLKARYIYNKYNLDCFADDTGLEIDALNGKPGVYSARYAGEPSDSKKNTEKVLTEMNGEKNRKARFRTVICLVESGESMFFEGKIEGRISEEPSGLKGFGYDPVFIPEGYNQTFADLTMELKNNISHRYLAVCELSKYLSAK